MGNKRKTRLIFMFVIVFTACAGALFYVMQKRSAEKAAEEAAARQREILDQFASKELMEERGIPEEAGFEWEIAEDFQFDLHGKSEEDLAALPIYHLTIPEDIEAYTDNLARQFAGVDYDSLQKESRKMSGDIPLLGKFYYVYTDEVKQFELEGTRMSVAVRTGEAVPMPEEENAGEDILSMTKKYIEACHLGVYDGETSLLRVEKRSSNECRAVVYFEDIPVDTSGAYFVPMSDGVTYLDRSHMKFSYTLEGTLKMATGMFTAKIRTTEKLSSKFASVEEICAATEKVLKREREEGNEVSTNGGIYDSHRITGAELVYKLGFAEENGTVELVATPWMEISSELACYWMGAGVWQEVKHTYGINLETGEVEEEPGGEQ